MSQWFLTQGDILLKPSKIYLRSFWTLFSGWSCRNFDSAIQMARYSVTFILLLTLLEDRTTSWWYMCARTFREGPSFVKIFEIRGGYTDIFYWSFQFHCIFLFALVFKLSFSYHRHIYFWLEFIYKYILHLLVFAYFIIKLS